MNPRSRKVIRDIGNNLPRSLLVIVSIAIGVFAFGGLFIARDLSLTNLLTEYGASNPADIAITLPPFDDDLVRWFERQQDVVVAQGMAVYSAQLIVGSGEPETIILYAYDEFDTIQVNKFSSHTGAFPPATNEILIEKSFAAALGVPVGTTVTIQFNEDRKYELTYAGTIYDVNTPPVYVASQIIGYISLRTLRELDLPAMYNRINLVVQRPENNLLATGEVASVDEIAENLRTRLRHIGIPVLAMSVNQDGAHWAVDILNGLLVVFSIVGLASLSLSAFLIVNVITALLSQQKRQIGVMKLVGASTRQIALLYLAMTAIYGLTAAMIALPASFIFARELARFVGTQINFDVPYIYFPLPIFLLEFAVALLTPLCAALLPIRSATRIPTVDALRGNTAATRISRINRLLARIAGLPRPMALGLRNTFRHKLRFISAVVTLAVAGVFFISIINVRASLQQFVDDVLRMSNFDVLIELDGQYSKSGIERRVAAIEGVTGVEGWISMPVVRLYEDGSHSETLTLYGMDVDSEFVDPPLLEGTWLSSRTARNRYHVVAGRGFMNHLGAQLNDTITLVYNGRKESFQIVGVVESNPQLMLLYTYFDTVVEFAKSAPVVDRLLIHTSTTDRDQQLQLALEISDYLDARNIQTRNLTLRSDIRNDVGGSVDIVVFILLGLALLTAIVGGLGLTGTMSLNVLERTREIAVMRAVGAGAGELRVVVVTEGLVTGLLSTALALPFVPTVSTLLGKLLGQVMLQQELGFINVPIGVVVWYAVVVLVSLVASLSPARQAARISIQSALAYE